MKKYILSLAFVAAGIFSFNALAQQPDCCTKATGTCSQNTECCKAPKKHKSPKLNPFEGITLTPEQQQSIDQLKEKCKNERTVAKKERKEKKEQARQEMKNSRKQYLEEIKNILTPEQYTKYLENMASKKNNGPKKNFQKGHRMGKKDRNSEKPMQKRNKDTQTQNP